MGGLIWRWVCVLYRIIDNKTLRLITERSGSPSKSEKVDNTLRGMSCWIVAVTSNFDILEGLSNGTISSFLNVINLFGLFAEKLIYFSDNFDPKLFLSRIHQHTSAADLEAGALGLKSDLKGRNLQKKQLVKDNFDCFVSCKTTIDGMYVLLNLLPYLCSSYIMLISRLLVFLIRYWVETEADWRRSGRVRNFSFVQLYEKCDING